MSCPYSADYIDIEWEYSLLNLKCNSACRYETSGRAVVAELIVFYDACRLEHAGHCIHPDSHYGKWKCGEQKYDRCRRFLLCTEEYEDAVANVVSDDCVVGPNELKRLVTSSIVHCRCCGFESCYALEIGIVRPTVPIAQINITNTVLALLIFDFPAYCLLEILEYSHPYVKYMNRASVIRVLQGMRDSRARCLQQRQQFFCLDY